MSKDITDSAVEAAENTTKRRSRKKSDVYFYAIPKGTDYEELEIPGSDEWSIESATEQLQGMMNDDDCIVIGPLYKVKKVAPVSNSVSVKVSLRDLNYSSTRFEGVHSGWSFIANGIRGLSVDGESFEDNDLLHIEFEKPVDEENKTRKPRFGKLMMVRRSALDECNEL